MRTLSLFCCLLAAVLALGAEINIEGTEGEEVSFKCSHKLASNNRKYLCKDPCKSDEDILVAVSPGEKAQSGRITLVDYEDGSFTVKISHLHLSDSRLYWCAVIRSVSNTYTSVNLTVLKAFKTTVPPIISSPWFLTLTNSTQMITSMGTNVTGNVFGEINSTSANGIPVTLGPLLYAAVGTATALIIFILATHFRKRREMTKPQLHMPPRYKDPRSEMTGRKCHNKGVKNDKLSSDGISIITHPLRQYPQLPTGPGVGCHVSLPIYENLPGPSSGSGSRNSPAEQQNIHNVENQIYITPLPAAASEINSVSQSVTTNPPSRLIWFGLDASQINPI